jgi:tape measure domain-containing protein
MSGTIDERVVSMQFNNGQFESGVKTTLDSLDKLKSGLNLDSATKSLQGLDDEGKKFSLSSVGAAAEGVSAKFVAMATVGITALVNITNKAIDTGIALGKSLMIQPITDGLHEYETNLNSIQTVLANTSSKGTTLQNVNDALQELNTYSDKTIYNFTQMAKNIGTFTSAGVDLKTSTAAIKGIANLAAVSGSSADQASTAMYQLSQAMASGTVKLMDWNSVVNAGMGGAVFQDSLKETARAHGIAVDAMIKKEGSFRDSLQDGWLTTNVLTETLSKFTGDLSAEQLKSMGYTDKQIDGILKMGVTAQDAATKVKTYSQLIDTLKEAVGSGWTQTWQTVFGDFDEAKTLWTSVNNVLGGMISASAQARNSLLSDWKDLGGRSALILTLKNAFDALMAVIQPIKDAFREIFPPATGKQLYDLTVKLEQFTAKLYPTPELVDQLKRTFSGLFAIFDIGKELISAIFDRLGKLGKPLGDGSNKVLDFTAKLGDWLVKLDTAVKKGDVFVNFFDRLENKLQPAIDKIQELGQKVKTWIIDLFSFDLKAPDIDTTGLTKSVDNLSGALAPFLKLGDAIKQRWGDLGEVIQTIGQKINTFAQAAAEKIGDLGHAIANAIKTGDFSAVLDAINVGLLGGILALLVKFFKGGIKFDATGGFLDSIKKAFSGLTDTMNAMQTKLKSEALMKIAVAIGILAASVAVLSLIDSARLTAAVAAVGALFAQLIASMSLFEKVSGSTGKMAAASASMVMLSGALLTMSLAVKAFSTMSWEELGKGISAVTVLLRVLAGAVEIMPQKGLILTATGLTVLGAALTVMAGAVKGFSMMSWEQLAKGMAAVAVGLGLIAGAVRLMPTLTMPLAAAGIALISVSINVLAGALKLFSMMSWEEIGRGLTAMAGGLLLVVAALAVIPPEGILGAAALAVAAPALVVFAKSMQAFGSMDWESIGKSLVALTGGLTVIALGLTAMVAALPGAVALGVASLALMAFVPVLAALGTMSWSVVGQGLGMLAAAFGVIAVGGLALIVALPGLMGLGVAIGLIGVGTLAAGVGLSLFAGGLGLIAAAGTSAAPAVTALGTAILDLIPLAIQKLGEGIVAFADVLANAGPTLLNAMVTLITTLLTAIDTTAPKIIDTLFNLVNKLVDTLVVNVPRFVDSGMKIIVGFLDGIANNIGKVVESGVNIVLNFMTGIQNAIPKLAAKAADVIIGFVDAIPPQVERVSERLASIGGDIGAAMIRGISKGLLNGVSSIVESAKSVAKSALDAAKNFLGIHSPSRRMADEVGEPMGMGVVVGLGRTSDMVGEAAAGVGETALTSMKNSMANLADVVPNELDMTPTIRPVLDLSNVQKNAGALNGMLTPAPLSVQTAYDQAAGVNAVRTYNEDLAQRNADLDQQQRAIAFYQYNNSPKALSPAEIYRQTRNQLSIAKGVLPT